MFVGAFYFFSNCEAFFKELIFGYSVKRELDIKSHQGIKGLFEHKVFMLGNILSVVIDDDIYPVCFLRRVDNYRAVISAFL